MSTCTHRRPTTTDIAPRSLVVSGNFLVACSNDDAAQSSAAKTEKRSQIPHPCARIERRIRLFTCASLMRQHVQPGADSNRSSCQHKRKHQIEYHNWIKGERPHRNFHGGSGWCCANGSVSLMTKFEVRVWTSSLGTVPDGHCTSD